MAKRIKEERMDYMEKGAAIGKPREAPKEGLQELPKEIELKKKLIICPKCKTEIEIDLTIDISPVSELIGAFQAMNNPKEDDNKS